MSPPATFDPARILPLPLERAFGASLEHEPVTDASDPPGSTDGGHYGWSFSEEDPFTGKHATREAAVAEAKEQNTDHQVVYTGQLIPAATLLAKHVPAIGDFIVDHLEQLLFVEVGEGVEIFDPSLAQREELGKLMLDAASRIGFNRDAASDVRAHDIAGAPR